MKVAIVSGLCVPHDAVSNSVLAQRKALLEAGHEVTVFAHLGSALEDDLVQTHDCWEMHRHPLFREADLAIFHHAIHYGLFDELALVSPGPVRVVHFHNITPPELLRGEARDAASEGLKQLHLAANADAVWCDSQHNSDVLVENADVHPDDVVVLPLCVPRRHASGPHTDPKSQGARKGFVSVGRIVPAKGLLTLVEAYSLLPSEVVGTHPLRILGRVDDSGGDFVERILTAAADLGIGGAVHLQTNPSNEEIQQAYLSSKVFVSPSRHEGFCIPVIEALGAGCTVISSDAGALPETTGGFGAIFGVGDAVRLAELMASAVSGDRPNPDGPSLEAYLDSFDVPAFNRRTVHEAERVMDKKRKMDAR